MNGQYDLTPEYSSALLYAIHDYMRNKKLPKNDRIGLGIVLRQLRKMGFTGLVPLSFLKKVWHVWYNVAYADITEQEGIDIVAKEMRKFI